jgi:hypothetical protein
VKRIWLIVGISAVTLGGGSAVFVSSAGANGKAPVPLSASSFAKGAGGNPGRAAYFALFDGVGGDTATLCGSTSHGRYTVSMSFRAVGGDAVMRVAFSNTGDFVDYAIPQDTSFSLEQAGGSTPRVDNYFTITKSSGAGDLVGWASTARIPGTHGLVLCFTEAS